MVLGLMLAAAVAAAPQLPPGAHAAIAPVLDAIAAERAEQAKLPPPKDDAERLVRPGRLDQAPRRAMARIDFTKAATDAERAAAFNVMRDAINAVDSETLPQVLAMVPADGWFRISRYGPDAAKAAFQIVQHSSIENFRRFLPTLEKLAAEGEVDRGDYALMYDRLAMNEGRPQRYGSQLRCEGGQLQPWTVEDLAKVDALRKEMGLPLTFGEYVAKAREVSPPCR